MDAGLRLWHLLDDSYQSPKTNMFLRLSSPIVNRTARDMALLQLMIALWEESLNKQLYLADAAGLQTSFSSKGAAGVELRISGFSDKSSLLVLQMIDALAHFKVGFAHQNVVYSIFYRMWGRI